MKEYVVLVDKAKQVLCVMQGRKVVESMLCSTGSGVPSNGGEGVTPAGWYRINRVVKSSSEGWPYPRSPRKPYGPYLCHLETLYGEDTTIAIHGTDEPEKLGTPVSAGCIRVSDGNIERLVKGLISVGTLVEVVDGS